VYVFVGPDGVFVVVDVTGVFVDDEPDPELVFVAVLAEVFVLVGGDEVFVGVFVRTGAPVTTSTEPQN
jgi:hypothetical protein